MRATKLVCTLGPASESKVAQLVEAGMDVARINCSHGGRDQQDRLLRAVRAAAQEAGRTVGILADLSGPKVRLGELPGGLVQLRTGDRFELHPDGTDPGDGHGASVSYPDLAKDLEPGDRVLLADGACELEVTGHRGRTVLTGVIRGGEVRSRAGVNVPSERLAIPAVTPKDEQDLRWALESGVDMLAQSFVRHADDVRALAALLPDPRPTLVAKLETSAAVAEADAIIAEADAVMVARGDLGVETPLEEIPVVQRRLVAMANDAATPVIVATQMLESMTASPRPTRAEAGDVAGAAFDGADGILLSAETAIGSYPVEAASTAARILETTETKGSEFLPLGREPGALELEELPLARAAALLARRGGARAVVVFTRSGLTARLVSAVRPSVPIYAFTPDAGVMGRMTLFHGVTPMELSTPEDTDSMISGMEYRLWKRGHVAPGDLVVMVASSPAGQTHANLLKMHRVAAL